MNVTADNPRDATGALISDVGLRAAAVISLHVHAGSIGKWAALRLSDGGSDGIPYDSRSEAINHQLYEQFCCYVKVPPDGMTPDDAYRYIELHRALYDAGYRLADPDMPGEPILPYTAKEWDAALRALKGS